MSWAEIASMTIACCTFATTSLTLYRACQTKADVRQMHEKMFSRDPDKGG